MKNIRIALMACLACFFATACQQEEEGDQVFTTNRFRVETPQFTDADGSKVYLNFSDAGSKLIYEEGDTVYVNGHEFTLTKDGSTWYANSTDGNPVVGKRFLVAYADGAVSAFDSASGTYHYSLNTNLTDAAHNKIVLGGTSASGTVLTLSPACAILRIDTKGAGANYDYIKVGFEGGKIPKAGTINVSNRTLSAGSNSNYMNGVAQGGGGVITGDFLYMTHSHAGENDYWYVAIPIEGNTVNTTLYLEWTINGGTPVQHKTQGQVTMTKGYVYTLGTDRQSPFTATGTTKTLFNTSPSTQVRFSASNLRARRHMEGSWTIEWMIGNPQYSVIGSGNTGIGQDEIWFDLFGYGTSGFNAGQTAYRVYSSSTTPGDYLNASIAGNNSDWGQYIHNHNTYKIKYGSVDVSSENWRTLTSDEWSYLINSRPNKSGLATVSGKPGLVLIPDYVPVEINGSGNGYVFIVPEGLSFSHTFSNFTTDNYSAEDWDKMEAAGAVFIPTTGYRDGVTYNGNFDGYYWSSSAPTTDRGNPVPAMVISNSNHSASIVNTSRARGCAVRLVVDVEED